jgi:hypothetical protein
MADSIRDELLSIPGIEEAELEGDTSTPAGVRVRLSADADTDTVGQEVRRVLATHGMRSHVTASDAPVNPPPPPGAPASVVTLPGVSIAPPPPVFAEEAPAREELLERAEEVPSRAQSIEELPGPATPESASPGRGGVRRLQSVAVEEGRGGVLVRVSADDDTSAERRSRPGAAGLDDAVVAAIGELVDRKAAPPLVLQVVEHEVAGTPLVTVVLELGDGSRRVGSAVAEGGRVYAVGYAAWLALSSF